MQIQLREICSPSFDFFLLVVLSGVIATFGLLINSPATIIGAMLVAPLMSPIIGLGLASITGDVLLLRFSASGLLRGALLAVLLAALLTWINQHLPFIAFQLDELPGEVMARTKPSPIDLGIALAGGLAAAFALAQPHLSAALPGVAIATALMPPLCTIGIGLSLRDWNVARGAALLFVTNAVTIAFAASLVFFSLGFGPLISQRRVLRIPRSLFFSALLTLALLLPLTTYSIQFVQQAAADRQLATIITEEVGNLHRSELVEFKRAIDRNILRIDITLRTTTPLRHQEIVDLQNAIGGRLHSAGLLPGDDGNLAVSVNGILVVRLDPAIPPTFTATPTPGPSLTPTRTATPSPSPTRVSPTPSPSASPSTTPTATPTDTPTVTPTPSLARVANTLGRGVRLRQSPEGPIIGTLQEGAPLTVLYGSEIRGGLVWIEVLDAEGRHGWLPQTYTRIVTLTPTPSGTPTTTSTPG